MPNIAFIAAAELEATRSSEMWTDISFVSSDPPVSGVSGAHGRVYDFSVWNIYRTSFTDTSLLTVKTRFRFVNSVDNEPFMQISDTAIHEQIRMVYRSTGAIEIWRDSVLLGSGGAIVPNTWYEIEWRARISNGAGMVAVNLDGNQIICVPGGANTQVSSNGVANKWSIGSNALGAQFDDCVVDLSGEYLGLGQVDTLMPSGVGDLSQLTPDSLVANYTRVNQKPHDGDTTYVLSTGDQIDTYEFEDIALSGDPLGVMLSCQALHTTGAPTLKLVCRIDGQNYESEEFTPGNTYGFMALHAWPVSPATGDDWTVATINAAQWGVHCLATGIHVTQVALQVYMKTADSDRCLAAGNRNYCLSVDNDFN